MNRQPEEGFQNSLQKLDGEINSSSVVFPSQQIIKISDLSLSNGNKRSSRFLNWFASLSRVAKLVVLGVAVLFAFAMLQAALKLVAGAISLTLLAVLVYLGYKFVVSGS
jgi:hypothetical protein